LERLRRDSGDSLFLEEKELKAIRDALDSPYISFIDGLVSMALLSSHEGRYKEAVQNWQTVNILKPLHYQYSRFLAVSLKANGEYEKALTVLDELIQKKVDDVSECGREDLIIYMERTSILRAQGKYADAENLAKKVYNRSRKLRDTSRDDSIVLVIALSAVNLARSLYLKSDTNSINEAEKLYKESLTIYLEKRGEAHPDTAASYNNIAAICVTQYKY
jgi:tetratricopeptide (TPR) repeat protein